MAVQEATLPRASVGFDTTMQLGKSLRNPRSWQESALKAWSKEQRGVISVITGGGKTTFALLLFSRLREVQEDLRLVVVVPTLPLLDQWVVALSADLGLAPSEIATYSGEGRASSPGVASVIVLNTARQVAEKVVADANPCLFVVDECHRAGSPENARALDVEADHVLGLSATPEREFDEGFSEIIEPALGPVVYEYGYKEARADGLIPDLEINNFRFFLEDDEQAEYDRLTGIIARRWRSVENPSEDPGLKRLLIKRAGVSINSKRRIVATIAVAERFPGRGIIFHERIAAAEQIARMLDTRGRRVAVYHSGMSASIRRRNLELFRTGQLETLVTCRSLDEGLNIPDAEIAVIAASTRSARQRVQRLGRVLRKSPGKATATVCTLYGTDPEGKSLQIESDQLDGIAEISWFEVKI